MAGWLEREERRGEERGEEEERRGRGRGEGKGEERRGEERRGEGEGVTPQVIPKGFDHVFTSWKWKTGRLRFLRVFLGKEKFMGKNWQDSLERVKGRLEKWRWLLPKMSFRGHHLVGH
ncbi:hypothetical protein D4764_07G0000960 [Takifugu flavidus]|uniref:Uncharacterized protein n=1 Tax=Takifugu flavidus TaxID=433684 RepID=A0A5C6MVH8_9TELE|nr:hypothetical protein D4764_07G0000960 [Takifugu flavidus]